MHKPKSDQDHLEWDLILTKLQREFNFGDSVDIWDVADIVFDYEKQLEELREELSNKYDG